jgi:NAD(P)-dependent dehydrogenase (short-subunit alcohol dehydrogenase family)
MNGKVLVITGALGALGTAVAETAEARGARVAGIDHASSQTSATPDRIEFGGVDLTDAAQASKAIDAAAAHFGRLDALINIAGGFMFETVADGSDKSWSACMP